MIVAINNQEDESVNSGVKFEQNIIEFLLSVLNSLEINELGIDGMLEKYERAGLPSVSDLQSKYSAYLTLKLMDEMPGGFFIYRADESEKILYANRALIELFQCDNIKEFLQLSGNSFRGMIHPDDRQKVEKSIGEQLAGSKVKLDAVEYRIITKNGNICWVDDYGHYVRSKSGESVFYVFIADVTERVMRQMEEREALLNEKYQTQQKIKLIHQEHLRRLETIEGLSIDYQSIFYADLDADRIHAYRVSERFEKGFGKGQKVRQYQGFDDDYVNHWVFPDDRRYYAQHTKADYIRNKLSREREFHINYRIFKGGRTAYIQLRVVGVGNGGAQIVMGYRDIDAEVVQQMKQKRKLEEALNQANFANKVKNSFLSNMSHDIRTPMNAIVGFANLAKSHMDDREKVENYLQMITSSSSELLSMLNNVFEITRIESSQIYIEEDEYSLLDILHNVQAVIKPRAQAADIDFSLDVSGLVHERVLVDQQKLSQILLCLAENALKYINTGDRIRISLMEQEHKKKGKAIFRFQVEDNGIGIHEEFLAHIFEPFEREKNTTLSGIHGSGLGLTIAKKIVDKMGGTIEVESTAGKGSVFTVVLTLEIPWQHPLEQKDTAKGPAHKPGQNKILLVDDNEINLEIGMEVLKDAGYPVDTATDGSIAVEIIKNSSPGDYALVLMDLQMPVMNGHDAAKEIRKINDPRKANIPIIALSANTFEEDKRMSMASGMNAHLAKPIDAPQLYEVIRRLLVRE